MLNAVKYKYSNGSLEGFNNKIKLLKRVSYGYSSFNNLRLRILIMSRLFVLNIKIMLNLVKVRKNLNSKMLPRSYFLFFFHAPHLTKSQKSFRISLNKVRRSLFNDCIILDHP